MGRRCRQRGPHPGQGEGGRDGWGRGSGRLRPGHMRTYSARPRQIAKPQAIRANGATHGAAHVTAHESKGDMRIVNKATAKSKIPEYNTECVSRRRHRVCCTLVEYPQMTIWTVEFPGCFLGDCELCSRDVRDEASADGDTFIVPKSKCSRPMPGTSRFAGP